MDSPIQALPSEGYLTKSETINGAQEIEEQISDFLIKMEEEAGEYYVETELEKLGILKRKSPLAKGRNDKIWDNM